MARALTRRRVAFLFLGETLLIPHLWPIVEALAARDPTVPIDLWVSTSVHERLLGRWMDTFGPGARVHIRRAPGFRRFPDDDSGRNPPLPAKLPMLLRLAPRLADARVAVCAELTSLWLPTMMPFLPIRFIKTAHGAGTIQRRTDPRRRATYRTLVPSAREWAEYMALGVPAAGVLATGYIKTSFRHRTPRQHLFADGRPIIVYAPHWQEHRSSWWDWGRAIVAMLVAQDRYNVILAPHQRLAERDPGIRAVLDEAGRLPHVHADIDSFATVDGSYTAAADIYLGDTSSQVVEYLARPRPCVFLNNRALDWRGEPDMSFWTCGEVVDSLDRLPGAIDEAERLHSSFAAVQRRFATTALGDISGAAPERAAEAILAALDD